jgi:hypothetical protein
MTVSGEYVPKEKILSITAISPALAGGAGAALPQLAGYAPDGECSRSLLPRLM